MKLRYYFLLPLLLLFYGAFAQSIEGVIHESDKTYAVGAVILTADNDQTVTDSLGRFYIKNILSDSLYIQYAGITTAVSILGKDFLSFYVPASIELHHAIVTAKRVEQLTNYTVIKKKALEAQPVLQTQEFYNDIPGLYMHAGALNTNRLTIRGIGSRSPFSTTKIKAYLNEIPLTSGIGETNLEDINLSLMDEMQVYKGPAFPRFGASLGGVIHYKNALEGRMRKLENSTSASSFGTYRNNFSSHFGFKRINGFYNIEFLGSQGYRDNNTYLRAARTAFMSYKKGNSSISVYTNFSQVDAEIPSSLSLEDYDTKPQQAAASWGAVNANENYKTTMVALSWQHQVKDKFYFSITPYAKSFVNEERRPFNVLFQDARTRGIRLNSMIKFHKNVRLRVGRESLNESEWRATREVKEIGHGKYLSAFLDARKSVNYFVEQQLNFWKFQLDLGLNFNNSSYVLDDRFDSDFEDFSGTFNYGLIYSPHASLNFRQSKNAIYYFKVARGFSIPTVEETLTIEGQRNESIRPEVGTNIEFGANVLTKHVDVSATLYYMEVEDLLVAKRVDEDQYIGINAGLTSHPGFETTIGKSYELSDKIKLSWVSSWQYSPHRFIDFIDDEIDYAGKLLPGNPTLKTTARIRLKYARLFVEIQESYVGKQFADDLNTILVDGYNLFNMQIGVTILHTKHWHLSTSVFAGNIFDTKYASMIAVNPQSFGGNAPRYLYPGLPRNFSNNLKLSCRFDSRRLRRSNKKPPKK